MRSGGNLQKCEKMRYYAKNAVPRAENAIKNAILICSLCLEKKRLRKISPPRSPGGTHFWGTKFPIHIHIGSTSTSKVNMSMLENPPKYAVFTCLHAFSLMSLILLKFSQIFTILKTFSCHVSMRCVAVKYVNFHAVP